jgi:hypothetical protein
VLLVESIARRHLSTIGAVLQCIRMQVRMVRLGRSHLLFSAGSSIGTQYSQACHAAAVAHSVGRNQAIGARRTTGYVAIDGRAAGYDTRVVLVVACYLAQSSESDRTILSTDRKAITGVSVATLVGQVVRSGRVATADGALLEMTLENVTARESVFAQVAGIRSVSGV